MKELTIENAERPYLANVKNELREGALKPIEQNGFAGGSKSSLPVWLKLKRGFSGEMHGDNDLIVRSYEFPELVLNITFKNDDDKRINTFIHAFKLFEGKLKKYSDLITELKNDLGVEFKRSNGELIVTQKDYGIDKHFSFTDGAINIPEALASIKKEAEDKCTEWTEKLYGLSGKGFKVYEAVRPNGSSFVTRKITYPDSKTSTCIKLHGELGRIDSDGMNEITKALATVSKSEALEVTKNPEVKSIETQHSAYAKEVLNPIESTQEAPVASKLRTIPEYLPRKKAAKRKERLPDEQKAPLIFDASTLQQFAVPRGNGRTWLDILPITADLPTVEKIYIPAHIADWEIRRGVACDGNDGKVEFKQIGIPKNIAPAAFDELLSTASRWRLDKYGKGYLIKGKNPNIVIYETPLDREFRDRAITICDSTPSQEDWEKYCMALQKQLVKEISINGKNFGLGEISMQATAREINHKGPAFLISDDFDFLNDREEIITKHGFPVGHAGFAGLMGAEISARGDEIKKRMEEHYGVPVGDFTLEGVKLDVLKAKPEFGDKYPDGYRSSMPGKYITEKGETRGEMIEELISRGAAIDRGEKTVFTLQMPGVKVSSKIQEKSQQEPVKQTPVIVDQQPAPAALPLVHEEQQPKQISTKPQQEISAPPAAETTQRTETLKDKGNIMETSTDTSGKSFGYKIGFHRIQRKMDEEGLANAIKKIVQSESDVHIDGETVRRWESNRKFPNENIYEALEQVLIHDNDKVTDKTKAKEEFRNAYDRSKKAFEGGSKSNDDAYAFVDTLQKYREQAGLSGHAELAAKLSEHLKFGDNEKPEKIDAMLIFKMGQGDHIPSLGLVRATIKALDEKGQLTDQEKKGIYDAYSKIKHKTSTKIAPKSGTFVSQVQPESVGLGDIIAIKKKMRSLYVNKDGEEIKASQIAIATKIPDPIISMILGSGKSLPKIKPEGLYELGDKLADKLGKINGDLNQAAEFKKVFNQYVTELEKLKRQEQKKDHLQWRA